MIMDRRPCGPRASARESEKTAQAASRIVVKCVDWHGRYFVRGSEIIRSVLCNLDCIYQRLDVLPDLLRQARVVIRLPRYPRGYT